MQWFITGQSAENNSTLISILHTLLHSCNFKEYTFPKKGGQRELKIRASGGALANAVLRTWRGGELRTAKAACIGPRPSTFQHEWREGCTRHSPWLMSSWWLLEKGKWTGGGMYTWQVNQAPVENPTPLHKNVSSTYWIQWTLFVVVFK